MSRDFATPFDQRIEAAARAGWAWECNESGDRTTWDELEPEFRTNLLAVCGVMLTAAGDFATKGTA